jgi:curli biogenesis system outer membrane secretion channel CsgG
LFGIGGGNRKFALTVGADIRVTDTRSTELVMAEAYSKQAVGVEVYGSIFRFFDSELFDVKIGSKSQEGLHSGIRWMLAEAAYNIVSTTLKHDGSCDRLLPKNYVEVAG